MALNVEKNFEYKMVERMTAITDNILEARPLEISMNNRKTLGSDAVLMKHYNLKKYIIFICCNFNVDVLDLFFSVS